MPLNGHNASRALPSIPDLTQRESARMPMPQDCRENIQLGWGVGETIAHSAKKVLEATRLEQWFRVKVKFIVAQWQYE